MYYGQPIRLYGRYRTAGPVSCECKPKCWAVRSISRLILTYPPLRSSNPQLDRMWASHRVDRLLGEQRSGATDSQVDEIVRLCEGYSIVSEYASFLVLENDAEYKRWQIARRNATRVKRDRKAQLALRQEFDQLQQQLVPNSALRDRQTRCWLVQRRPKRVRSSSADRRPSPPSGGTDLNVPHHDSLRVLDPEAEAEVAQLIR